MGKMELTRFAAGVTATPEALVAAAPAESGGDLEHQVQEGKKLIDLAKDLDAITAKIYETKNQLDTITTRDASGQETKLVTLFNVSDFLRPLINPVGTLSTALGTLNTQHGKTITDLSTATAQNLVALTRTMRGTDTWKRFLTVSEKAGAGVFMKDLDHWVGAVSEEGAAEMILALSRFFAAGVQNPQALATVGASTLDKTLGPWLNTQATTPGSKVAAASAGLLSQMVQSTAMLAAMSADPDGLKRILGQLMGTVLSAFSGSEAARAELEEMVPFWSWITMGEDTARLWTQGKYYECGKKACELLVQAVGDVTILIPVIKGVACALKAGATVTARLVPKVIQQVGKFVRSKEKVVSVDAINHFARACMNNGCFPSGTLVLMADRSLRPIQLVKAGDFVLADNPEDTSPPRSQMVMDVPEYQTDHLVQVSLDRDGDNKPDAVIRATREHPFWTLERDWVFAIDLQPGERCLSADGQPMTVTSTTVQEAPERAVYNLTVSGDHSFFVQQGGCSVLVHNTNQVSRQWIVYMIELDTPAGEPQRFYVGRASKASTEKISKIEVWDYRAGPDGHRHHIWTGRQGRGSEFLLPKVQNNGHLKFHIVSSYWSKDFKSGYDVCRGIEHDIHTNLVAANQHDLKQSIPLGSKPEAEKNRILSAARTSSHMNKAINRSQRVKAICP